MPNYYYLFVEQRKIIESSLRKKIEELTVLGANTLKEVVDYFRGNVEIVRTFSDKGVHPYSQLRGGFPRYKRTSLRKTSSRGSAAGNHNIILLWYQPFEDRVITVSRAAASITYPARIMVIKEAYFFH